jgi:hypothetical protein
MRLLSFLVLLPLALVVVAEPAPPRINNNAAGAVFLPGPVISDYKSPKNIGNTNHEFVGAIQLLHDARGSSRKLANRLFRVYGMSWFMVQPSKILTVNCLSIYNSKA